MTSEEKEAMKGSFPQNFSYEEMTRSRVAIKYGFNNEPSTDQEWSNLLSTAWWLQGLRDKIKLYFGREHPIIVTSGYRSPRLNKEIGGSSSSAHMRGLAADIVVPGIGAYQLAQMIADCFGDYDQVVNEFGRWVHVGLSEREPRQELLTAYSQRNFFGIERVKYVRGIQDV